CSGSFGSPLAQRYQYDSACSPAFALLVISSSRIVLGRLHTRRFRTCGEPGHPVSRTDTSRATGRGAAQATHRGNQGVQSGKAEPRVASRRDAVSSLEYWASLGNLGKVKLELQKGADVNARGANGYTALHAAAQDGHVEVVRLLLSHNADRKA